MYHVSFQIEMRQLGIMTQPHNLWWNMKPRKDYNISECNESYSYIFLYSHYIFLRLQLRNAHDGVAHPHALQWAGPRVSSSTSPPFLSEIRACGTRTAGPILFSTFSLSLSPFQLPNPFSCFHPLQHSFILTDSPSSASSFNHLEPTLNYS
jgi:hypothetical protein